MKKTKILVFASEYILSQEVQWILEDEEYEINFVSILNGNIINYLENSKPNLVIIDIDNEEIDRCIQLGQYLLNEDLIPFIYIYLQKQIMEFWKK